MLRLFKGTGSNIECELFEAWLDVEDLIPYEAISYTWGSMELSATVTIDGKTLSVTENLYLALQNLRLGEADRVLWVDAICINQSNHRERGHQVQQMGSVYSQADRVIIWLGPATDDTNVLLDSLKRLEQESTKINHCGWTIGDRRWKDLWSSLQLELMGTHWNLAARQRAGLKSLLKRAWFRRIWILQEAANAKRAIICSGTRFVSTRIFVLAPSLLDTELESGCQAVLNILPGSSRKESWWNKRPDLYTLLLKFSGSKAGDPRDMIFALLGICSDTQDTHIISVDYTKKPVQVINDAALFLFDISDCFYGTVYELMHNVTSLNTKCLLKKVELGDLASIVKFFKLRGKNVRITEEITKAAAGNKECGEQLMELLFDQRGGDMRVTEEVVKAAVGNMISGEKVVQFLLDRLGSAVKITAEVFKTAMRNKMCGKEVIQLLDRRGIEVVSAAVRSGIKETEFLLNECKVSLRVTKEIVEAAASNETNGNQVMDILLKLGGEAINLTDKLVAELARSFNSDHMTLLLRQHGSDVRITEEVVEAAARNRASGKEVMQLLLEQRAEAVDLTDRLVERLARSFDETHMALLLKQRGGDLRITEAVVQAAARNSASGEQIMRLLIEQGRSNITITEGMVKNAAGNAKSGKNMLQLLLEQRAEAVDLTDRLVEDLARFFDDTHMAILLEQRGGDLRVTEEVVKAVARNGVSGAKIMRLLVEQRRSDVRITDEVIQAAATNTTSGEEVIQFLLQQCGEAMDLTESLVVELAGSFNTTHMTLLLELRGDDVRITEEVVKAAARNRTNGKQIMHLLLEQRAEAIDLTDRVIEELVTFFDRTHMELLLKHRGHDVRITETAVQTAARKREFGEQILSLLLHHVGDDMMVTEEISKAAAANTWRGKQVIQVLLDHQERGIMVTEEVVKAAAGNIMSGKQVMQLLLEQREVTVDLTDGLVAELAGSFDNTHMALLLKRYRGDVRITEEVVKAASRNKVSGKQVMLLLLQQRAGAMDLTDRLIEELAACFDSTHMALLLEQHGSDVIITEGVIKAAAGNTKSGKQMMWLLLSHQGSELRITEEVVRAAAGNATNGEQVMQFLLDQRGTGLKITEEVVEAAAGNGKCEVMRLLLDHRGADVRVTEKVVKAATRNTTNGKQIMRLLLERRGNAVDVTDKMVAELAASFEETHMALLLEQHGGEVKITEEIVQAAARNTKRGEQMMQLLLDHRGGDLMVTEEVVEAAAENIESGAKVIQLLLEQQGANLRVTEEVVKAAAGNRHIGVELIKLLLDYRGKNLRITRDMIDSATKNTSRGGQILELLQKQ